MSTPPRSYSDVPTIDDEFGFNPSVDALCSIINGTSLGDTPLTIGVFGPWGSGKTSLMQMIKSKLDVKKQDIGDVLIWFDAWRYSKQDALWRALLLAIVENLRNNLFKDSNQLKGIVEKRLKKEDPKWSQDLDDRVIDAAVKKISQQFDDLVASLYRNVEREEPGDITVDWHKAGAQALGTAVRIGFSMVPVWGAALNIASKAVEKAQEKVGEGEDASDLFDIFQREKSKIYRDQVQSLEQFYEALKRLIKEWVVDTQRKLILFVDDLDRCLPEDSVSVLEAIKVFLDIQGVICVLGFDRTLIQRGIKVRYKEFALAGADMNSDRHLDLHVEGRDFLEKIVQVPFEVPALQTEGISRFVTKRLDNYTGINQDQAKSISMIMAAGLIPNPRKLKRAVNSFRLLLAVAGTQQGPVSTELIGKLTIIQNSYSNIYLKIVENEEWLLLLEKIARGTLPLTAQTKVEYKVVSQDPYSVSKKLNLEIPQTSISKEWVDLAQILAALQPVIEQSDKKVEELNNEIVAEVNRLQEGFDLKLFDLKIKVLEDRERQKAIACIPYRLCAMLSMPPFFGSISYKELHQHITLARFTQNEGPTEG